MHPRDRAVKNLASGEMADVLRKGENVARLSFEAANVFDAEQNGTLQNIAPRTAIKESGPGILLMRSIEIECLN